MFETKHVRVVIVTPEKAILDEIADSVVLPLFDGELGVLPGRAPLTGRLGPGELRMMGISTEQRYFVDGGFVQVSTTSGKTAVTVLTPKAYPASAVTQALCQETEQQANAMPTATPFERESRYKAQERARGLARVAAKG
ncbi:MAG: F0F1 ATP synthase subunit epsilon [Bacteroidales bacterium]|nr:F0F1 ATP synthase subunit epsilon [Bacteroidales bacterium]